MIAEIKREMEKGPITVGELAEKLNVSKERMEEVLHLMISMGIIEEVVPVSCPSQEKLTCSFCPLKNECGSFPYRAYVLRKKGNKRV